MRGEGFWQCAPEQCAAQAFLPLLRGRWRGAPDEVVDVDDRPFIRLFSLRSKSLPLRYSRIGARLKKPSNLAFSYASRPTVGRRLLVVRSRAMRRASVGFPWGKLCAAQPLCDEGKPVVLTCLVRSLAFPSSVSSPVGRTATFPALRLRRGGRLLVGRMQKSNAPRKRSFPY